jgi:adenosylhomocysteine nucleosidase
MIVMTAATGQEADVICRCLDNKRPLAFPGKQYRAWRGTRGARDVLVVRTGMGKQRVEDALDAVLASHAVEAVVSVGFGGGLSPDLRSGDLVVCATTISVDSGTQTGRYHADERLVRRAGAALGADGRRWSVGNGITVLQAARDAAAKQALRETCRAEVCEMEDYWAARLAGARGIPFLAVRAVYDELDAALPDYENMIDGDGNIRPFRAAANFTSHPVRLVTSLLGYRRAEKALAGFIAGFLDMVES